MKLWKGTPLQTACLVFIRQHMFKDSWLSCYFSYSLTDLIQNDSVICLSHKGSRILTILTKFVFLIKFISTKTFILIPLLKYTSYFMLILYLLLSLLLAYYVSCHFIAPSTVPGLIYEMHHKPFADIVCCLLLCLSK